MIEIRIADLPWSNEIGIAIFEKGLDGKFAIALPTDVKFMKLDDFDSCEPTLRINRFMAEDLFRALAEILDKRGIKTENDFKIKGLLEAKEHHLQDMRRLVFKNIAKPKDTP